MACPGLASPGSHCIPLPPFLPTAHVSKFDSFHENTRPPVPILEQKLEPGTEPLGSPGARSKALLPGEWRQGSRHLEGRGTGLLALGEGVVASGEPVVPWSWGWSIDLCQHSSPCWRHHCPASGVRRRGHGASLSPDKASHDAEVSLGLAFQGPQGDPFPNLQETIFRKQELPA